MRGSLAALAITAAAMAGGWPALRWGRRPRAAVLLVVGGLVLAAPLLIPREPRTLRLVAAIAAATLAVKLYDLHVGASRGHRPSWRGFLAFQPNPFGLVERRLDDLPRPPRGDDRRRVARGGCGTVLGGLAFAGLFGIDWARVPFLVEHAAKAIGLYAMLVPLGVATSAAWRLCGGRSLDMMHNPFAARTPADFWRRYNRPVTQLFVEDVYRPLGGRRAPARVTLVVFAVSALVHEYVFAVPIGRVEGVQTAFFLVQGLAVLATARLRPRGSGAVLGAALTLTFNVLSSLLFFRSLGEIVPFYAARSSS